MLRELVSQARSGTSPELEAVTAERDFFREKYAEQIDAMELLKGELKESQRTIAKLRGQILDLEVEKSKLSEQGKGESSSGSTNTSVTCMTYEDESLKSGVDNNCERMEEPATEAVDPAASREEVASPRNTHKTEQTQSEPTEAGSPDAEDDMRPTHSEESEDTEEDESGSDEDDEIENIRANAERMLMWANYQTSKRSTPNTSLIQEDGDDESKSDALATPSKGSVSGDIVYSLPTSLDKRQSIMDDDSTLGSSSRQHREPSVGSWRSGKTSSSNGGRIGNLLNNLRDMIDPESESEGETGV